MAGALLALLAAPVQAETCRFAGTTTHGGRVAVRAETTAEGALTTVAVTVALDIAAWVSDVRYLGEEISTWRGGALQSLAVNQRTSVGGSVKRQQWDVFTRNGARLEAYRVQAKRLDEFRLRHPGFVQHWPQASFGAPWLGDYRSAGPERRPDLDLPAADAGTRSPLALAFYWSRFLPPEGGAATVVLPGFKRDVSTDLRFGPARESGGGRRWSAPMRHPGLEPSPLSTASVWVSPDHYLLQIGFDVHTSWASGQALLRAEGCQGVQVAPD